MKSEFDLAEGVRLRLNNCILLEFPLEMGAFLPYVSRFANCMNPKLRPKEYCSMCPVIRIVHH